MKNNYKLLSALALSGIFSTAVIAIEETDTLDLSSTIATSVVVDAGTHTLDLAADTTSSDMTISANVPFTIKLTNANSATGSKLLSGTDEIDYSFSLANVETDTTYTTFGETSSSQVTHVDAKTYTLTIDPAAITAATDAGTYTDTITVTITH